MTVQPRGPGPLLIGSGILRHYHGGKYADVVTSRQMNHHLRKRENSCPWSQHPGCIIWR